MKPPGRARWGKRHWDGGLVDFDMFYCQGWKIDGGDCVGGGAVECAGVEDQGAAFLVRVGPVRVAVTDQIELLAVDRLPEEAVVVAVDEGDSTAGEFDFAESFVAGLAGGLNGAPQAGVIVVDVSEDEVRGPFVEEGDDVG